jgi:hypothetical protein
MQKAKKVSMKSTASGKNKTKCLKSKKANTFGAKHTKKATHGQGFRNFVFLMS